MEQQKQKQPQKQKEKLSEAKNRGISSRIKKFAMLGVVILVIYVFYKNNFNFNAVKLSVKEALSTVKVGNFTLVKPEEKKETKPQPSAGLRDVSSYEAPQKISEDRSLTVEGIFYDPQGTSFTTISGRVLREGQSVYAVTINKINMDSIEVTVNGENKAVGVRDKIMLPAATGQQGDAGS